MAGLAGRLFGIPFLAIDLVFFGANLLKIPDGAYMPLIFGGG